MNQIDYLSHIDHISLFLPERIASYVLQEEKISRTVFSFLSLL